MEEFILSDVTIWDPKNSFHRTQKHIHIKKGYIINISSQKIDACVKSFYCKNLFLSIGWFDMSAALCEPGFEYKDTINTLDRSASFGGFTELAVFSNTKPALQSRESIQFVKNSKNHTTIDLHPIAVVTTDCHGKSITELMDLYHAGAVAFSDGIHSITDHKIIQQILLYLKSFNGLFMNHPQNARLEDIGQIHEGEISTMMGMKGIPILSEEMGIQRDISILKYTGGKIHFSQISSARGIEIIRLAKKQGLNVTCDIAVHQIAFIDEDLGGFDTHLKVNPPFRTKEDIEAIWRGIEDDTIDVIVSHHLPQDQEAKQVAFDEASFGILSLETTFAVLNTYKPTYISLEKLLEKLTFLPRKILKQKIPNIQVGEKANFTLFDVNTKWIFEEKHIQSLSKNTPFINTKLIGRAVGIINGEKCAINEDFLAKGD